MPEFSFGDGNTANKIISAILGDSWHNMFATGPTGGLADLIVNIFQIFNSVVIMATALIVGYTLWSGVVQTAHEGQSMGKRYSSLWTPIRMAAGAALTAPIFGVSLVQMIVLAITALSFSVADNVANELGSFIGRGGSISIAAPMTQRDDAHRLTAVIMYSETCMMYKNSVEEGFSLTDITGPYTVMYPKWDSMKWTYGEEGLFGSGDQVCGAVDVNYSALGEFGDDLKVGIENVTMAIRPAARAIVSNEADIDYNHYKSAVEAYSKLMTDLVKRAESGGSEEIVSASQELQNSIRDNGWINLGMWYYKIMSISAIRSQSIQFDFNYIAPENDAASDDLGGLTEYYSRAGGYVSRAASSMSEAGDINPVGMDDLNSEASQAWIEKIRDILADNKDPFLAMVEVGQTSMNYGLGIFGTGKIAEGIFSIFKKVPGAEGFAAVAGGAAWIGALLIGLGAWLGWYLPMLPFVNWVIGVIGVFIAIAQSLFASQIWAAAHAMPEGEGIAGTHAKQGYMLLISLALRPILIVMGFIFSYYILWAGCWLSLEGLKVYVTTISSGGMSDMVGVLVALVVSAILVTTILHRALGFIFESADDILTWIGGSRQLGSEQQSVQRALGAFGMIINRGHSLRGLSGQLKKGMGGSKPGGDGTGAGITATPK